MKSSVSVLIAAAFAATSFSAALAQNALEKGADSQVVGAEVVPPLRDAVSFVDGHQIDRATSEERDTTTCEMSTSMCRCGGSWQSSACRDRARRR